MIGSNDSGPDGASAKIDAPRLLQYPYPYKAAFAISNDCEFLDFDRYCDLQRMLCGPDGLGLETSGSVFFYTTDAICYKSMSYFKGVSDELTEHAPAIREIVRAGYLDTIHAYGDFDAGGFKRAHAMRVAEECRRYGMKFSIFSNHGSDQNFQNVGHNEFRVYHKGDLPESDVYHTDILDSIGIEYYWVDNGLREEISELEPIVYEKEMGDGKKRKFYIRLRGLLGKTGPYAISLAHQLTDARIEEIVESRAATILYQHFGVTDRNPDGSWVVNDPLTFDTGGMAALVRLSKLAKQKDLFVTTVSRLLRYLDMHQSLSCQVTADHLELRSTRELQDADLEGVSIAVDRRFDLPIVLKTPSGEERVLDLARIRTSDADMPHDVVWHPYKFLEPFQW